MRGVALLVCSLGLGAIAPAAPPAVADSGRWEIENAALRVTLDPAAGRFVVLLKSTHHQWTQAPGRGEGAAPAFQNMRRLAATKRTLTWEFTPAGLTNAFQLTLSLPAKGADLSVELKSADPQTPIRDFFPLPPLAQDSSDASLVVADYCNGHLYSLREPPLRTWFNLWDIDMPWVGVCDVAEGWGYALIVETDDDATIRLVKESRAGHELWAPQAGFQASQGQFRTPRRFFYHFTDRGGYVELAKRFRQYARERGWLVTFKEKLRQNPNLVRLFGAADVWGDASLKFAREAKAAGVDKMIIHGRTAPADMQAINALGYLTSEYDNYTDIFQVEPGKPIDAQHGQVPGEVVLQADGQRMKAWITWDKQQYMKRCPSRWVPAAKVVVPKAVSERPFLGRFIDVTTAEALYECFDPAHPLTRTQKRRCGEELLGYVRSLGLVTGGEHGRYWAVPELDYIEGMMSGTAYPWPAGHLIHPKTKDQTFEHPWGGRYPKWADYAKWNLGAGQRVPLWELVFHDCVVSTWYWGDSNDFLLEAAPEFTARKDAFNILYGTIPILWANREGGWHLNRDAFLRSCRNTSKFHELVADKEMLSHEFLTPDRGVQRTRFSGGFEVTVNLGAEPALVKFGLKTQMLPPNGFVVKGPKIRQLRTLKKGQPRTVIHTRNFHFTENQ